MKKLLPLVAFVLISSFIIAQPCKVVKVGMLKSEVRKLAGKPTEMDTLGSEYKEDGSKLLIVAWQYGEVGKDRNQRVEFMGDKVSNVIANGKKYDELMKAFHKGDIPKGELTERIEKLNSEECR